MNPEYVTPAFAASEPKIIVLLFAVIVNAFFVTLRILVI